MTIAALSSLDEPLVWHFLALAAHAEVEEVRANPLLARYAQGWGREGDFALSAARLENGHREVVGLVWSRLHGAEAPGFGFVAPDVPEVSIAVESERRNQRIGRQLLERYLSSARHRFRAVSLSVREDNVPAIRLYASCGFYRIDRSERTNRTGGTSFTMMLRF